MESWTDRRVIAYAHQGGSFEAPSSTLYAIERALAAGATGIELDVHATADRKLVVCHDASVDRTTGGSGLISSFTWAELSKLDNAYWFIPGSDAAPGHEPEDYPFRGLAPTDDRFRIARLAEVLDLMDAYPGVALNLDIKQTYPDVEPYEQLLADLIAARSLVDRVLVASFHDSALVRFARSSPAIATAAGPALIADLVRAAVHGTAPPRAQLQAQHCKAIQAPVSFQGIDIITTDLVGLAHEEGLAVHVWTINDEPEMARLADLGVDGIITDVPTVLVSLLSRSGTAWVPAAASSSR